LVIYQESLHDARSTEYKILPYFVYLATVSPSFAYIHINFYLQVSQKR